MPSTEDINKQMQEINQFANARILTLLAAVALVAASSGVLLPGKLTVDPADLGKTFFGCTMVSAAIAFLVGVDRRLTRLIRMYAGWLLHYGKSDWEKDVRTLLGAKHGWKINRPMWVPYMTLAGSMLAVPWALSLFSWLALYPAPFPCPGKGVIWAHSVGCVTSMAFIGLLQVVCDIKSEDAAETWKEVLVQSDETQTEKRASSKEGFEIYDRWRAELQNEDERLGERGNWALGLQGLLFVAYTQSGQLWSTDKSLFCSAKALGVLIAAAGAVTALLSLCSILAATVRMVEIWTALGRVQKQFNLEPLHCPQIGRNKVIVVLGLFMALLLPVALLIIWFALAVARDWRFWLP